MRSRERWRQAVVATSVLTGLVASGVVNIWIERPDQMLPGIALGSHALLVAERSVAFFAIWLLLLVVVGHALRGRLPTEVSGHGVRYADAPTTQAMASGADRGLADLRAEVAAQRAELMDLQALIMWQPKG